MQSLSVPLACRIGAAATPAGSPSTQGFGFSAEDSAGAVFVQVEFEVVEAEAGDNGGGGCSSAPAAPSGGAIAAALTGALAWLARRRRR